MVFQWFLPSMYGDIKLDKISNETTRLTLSGLSPTEKDAMQALFKRASNPSALQALWAPPSRLSTINLDALEEQSVELDAPITKVQDFLQKKLKPHRKQVSAVRFSNGKVEQITEATLKTIDTSSNASGSSTPSSKEKTETPAAAVTVAQPVLGCPAPDFDDVEVRATRVLRTFLTPEQIADFERRQQFVAVGADTGHRYLLSSRNSKHALRSASYRSLYDMDERVALCVHDWEVPASEELLALYLHVSLPGLERYVRSIPDRDGLLA